MHRGDNIERQEREKLAREIRAAKRRKKIRRVLLLRTGVHHKR